MKRLTTRKMIMAMVFCGIVSSVTAVAMNALELRHLESAMNVRGLSTEDLSFEKDIVTNQFISLRKVHLFLQQPLLLADFGETSKDVLESVDHVPPWEWIADMMEWSMSAPPSLSTNQTGEMSASSSRLSSALQGAISDFLAVCRRWDPVQNVAVRAVTPVQRQYAAASILYDSFDAGKNTNAINVLKQLGIPGPIIHEVAGETDLLDLEPAAKKWTDIVKSVDQSQQLAVHRALTDGLHQLCNQVKAVQPEDWPDHPVTLSTSLGKIRIGTVYDDVYLSDYLLIIDPAGNDIYQGFATASCGLLMSSPPFAITLDLAGNDLYRSEAALSAGGALWGHALLWDMEGDDVYESRWAGQACSLFGMASLVDFAGDDTYRAYGLAQSAAVAGMSFLGDLNGNDTYILGQEGQAYAGVDGCALLVDKHGCDTYSAGRIKTDYERHDLYHLSLAQGFAIGMRPFAGGGVAVLFDQEGNDSYLAEVYAQGVSYWYSMGLLIDMAGEDRYHLREYGQGTGIHLSCGLMIEERGNDTYYGFSLAQGSAHDYAVGMLFDRQGSDLYTADHHAQGRGINNAFGLLMDSSGNDVYFAVDTDQSQGIGNIASMRDYESLSMLLDLQGQDRYSSGVQNNSMVLRPDIGIVYDVDDDQLNPDKKLPEPILADATPYTTLSMNQLMLLATKYGDSPLKRQRKQSARDEFYRRGTQSLFYFMQHANAQNMWYLILAEDMVRHLPPEESAPVLLSFLTDPNREQIKYAAFFLGLHDTPQYTDDLLPLLNNPYTAGAAMRTLGNWKAVKAIPLIIPYTDDPVERRRIAAVNALGAIGDPQVVPILRKKTQDSVFTVRQRASHALKMIEKD